MYAVARYCTSPDMIKFACRHGIKQNPMYLKCDACPNRDSCEIHFSLTPPPKLSPQDIEFVAKTLADSRKKPKRSPEEQRREILIGLTVWAVIIFLAWLSS